MINLRNLVAALLILVLAAAILSCSSESAQTQQLYTSSKQKWDEVNKAFTLPKGQERTQLMYKFINDKYDEQIVDSLQQYLNDAPNGKYAKEAQSLLNEAKESQMLRALGQMRTISGQGGIPQNQAEADSLMNKSQQMSDTTRDTTKTGK